MAGGFPNVKHLWIQDPSGIGDPASVSEVTPEYPGSVGKVGQIRESAGKRSKVLQYVKREATDTGTAAAGSVAYWADDDDFVVVLDQTRAKGGSTAPVAAGVFVGSNPQIGSYGYIQVAGTANLKLGNDVATDVVAGEQLYVAGADADGKVQKPTAGTDAATIAAELLVRRASRVGIALAAQTDSSGTVPALLNVDRNGW